VTVNVGRYRAASVSTSPRSWNAFDSRSTPAFSSSQKLTRAYCGRRHIGPTLSQLSPTSADKVRKVLRATCLKPLPTHVLPTSLLRSSVDDIAPVIAHIANLSFKECRFPAAFRTALLKKPSLDKEQMSSYRPISNLTTVSKVIARLVLARLRPTCLRD